LTWFTHRIDERCGRKMKEVVSKYGMEGYGLVWVIYETMYSSPVGEVEIRIPELSRTTGIRRRKLKRMVDFLESVGCISRSDTGLYFSHRVKSELEAFYSPIARDRRDVNSYYHGKYAKGRKKAC
jgi:predicted transcriptional regulator